MYCKNCGAEINENAFICTHCGALVNEGKKPKSRPNKTEKQDGAKSSLEIAKDFIYPIAFCVVCLALVFVFSSIAGSYYKKTTSGIFFEPISLSLSCIFGIIGFLSNIVAFIFSLISKSFKLKEICYLGFSVTILISSILLTAL